MNTRRHGTSQSAQADLVEKRPSPSTVLLSSLFTGASLVVITVGLSPWVDVLADISIRLLLVVLTVLVVVWYTRRRYYKPLITSHRSTDVLPVPEYQVSILQRSSAGRDERIPGEEAIERAQAQIFTLSILQPRSVRRRITERYEPYQRTLVKRVHIDARVPAGMIRQIRSNHGVQPVVLFPVVVLPKGEMVDNLRVLAADGSAVPTLSYAEYLQLAARVMRTLLAIGYGCEVGEKTHSKVIQAERLALQGVLRRASGNLNDCTGSEELRSLCPLPDTAPRSGDPPNPAAIRMAARLAEWLTRRYAIVAAVPCSADGRLSITYERFVTPPLGIARRAKRKQMW
jgi:hypothetical protein